MEARDLRVVPPRRWTEQLGGICWLPRLIDKARSAMAGTLGDYLFGQSPMDSGLLQQLGVSHADFARIVRGAPNDDAVLAALEQRDPAAVARTRAWSTEHFPKRHKLFLWLMDFDDGYVDQPWRACKRASNVIARAITTFMKRAFPSNAAERAKAD